MCKDRLLINIPKHPTSIYKFPSTFYSEDIDGNNNPYFSFISNFLEFEILNQLNIREIFSENFKILDINTKKKSGSKICKPF